MTERQLNLKYEIISISDIFQLGISINDQEWFYKFVQRMSVATKMDAITIVSGWTRLNNTPELSEEFCREFENKINIPMNFAIGNRKLPIEWILQLCNNSYLCGMHYYAVLHISKDERLTNELVLKYESLFDQTYGRCGHNAVPYNRETAWYFISNNDKISGDAKNKAVTKPKLNKFAGAKTLW